MSRKFLHTKLSKGLLAGTLLFSFQAGTAWADQPKNGTLEVQTTVEAETSEQEAPSILPGDLFYFVKIVIEKIQLALESDDVEKARMIASFAKLRIAEANELLDKGENELAQEVLQTASESHVLALSLTEKNEDEEDKDEKLEGQALDEDQDDVEKDDGKEAEEKEVEVLVHQNIDSLKKVLEKVKKNPPNSQAAAAIERNIQKSLEHWKKKARKNQANDQVVVEEEDIVEIITEIDEEAKAEANTEVEAKVDEEMNKQPYATKNLSIAVNTSNNPILMVEVDEEGKHQERKSKNKGEERGKGKGNGQGQGKGHGQGKEKHQD